MKNFRVIYGEKALVKMQRESFQVWDVQIDLSVVFAGNLDGYWTPDKCGPPEVTGNTFARPNKDNHSTTTGTH